jgi:hypothetical protein
MIDIRARTRYLPIMKNMEAVSLQFVKPTSESLLAFRPSPPRLGGVLGALLAVALRRVGSARVGPKYQSRTLPA